MMKNLLIGLIVLTLFSCSSNPKIKTEKNLEQILIEKPKLNYKLKSLPKYINVIYFSDSKIKTTLPDEVKGFLTSYYSFAKQHQYFPIINFINLKEENSCSLSLNRGAYNFIFLLEGSADISLYNLCLNKFISKDTISLRPSQTAYCNGVIPLEIFTHFKK